MAAAGTPVAHVHADGRLEPHAEAETRLLALAKLPERDLLLSRAALIDAAYARQEERAAYAGERAAAGAG